jgi:hypothetical protein
MRLIDADALMPKLKFIREAEHQIYGKESWGFVSKCITAIEDAPTIEERKKGKWIKKMRITKTEKYTSYDPDWYCACCGAKYDPHIARIVNFCYVCGADMRGEQDETD